MPCAQAQLPSVVGIPFVQLIGPTTYRCSAMSTRLLPPDSDMRYGLDLLGPHDVLFIVLGGVGKWENKNCCWGSLSLEGREAGNDVLTRPELRGDTTMVPAFLLSNSWKT